MKFSPRDTSEFPRCPFSRLFAHAKPCRRPVRNLLLFILLCHTAIGQSQAEVRWNDSFKESYHSEADSADISFDVRTPPRTEGIDTYPLIVALSGGFRISPNEAHAHFQVRPSRTGTWGYRSISTYDAMQVIQFMKQNYPVDPNRVYLVGSSAGGSGAMHLASCFPDEFAAVLPLIAAGNFYPLQNFSNLPVAFHHGDRDWTSAVCNVRVQAQRMQALGYPTILKEYPGAGHGIPGSHEPLAAWLFEQRRNPAPKMIRHECETPRLGKSYWLRIVEFDDPHRRASIEAEITEGVVTIRPQNVVAFSLALDLIDGAKAVHIGESTLSLSESYHLESGLWKNSPRPSVSQIRPYEAGGAANLYQGEPLLIVYGTNGEHAAQLKAAAEKLAAYGGPAYTPMRRSRFPVVSDKAITSDQQVRCNLILIGRPSENSVTQSLWSQLPVSVEDDVLKVASRAQLALENQVLGLLHPNPDHPERLVYVLAPFTDAAGLDRFKKQPQYFLSGSDGFDRVSQPDLVVQDLEYRLARQMQFGKDWQWLNLQGAKTPLPTGFGGRASFAVACMKTMLGKSRADFALWWGPADKGMWGFDFNYLPRFNSRSYTLADFRTQRRISETTLGKATGAELKDIWTRWGQNQELISYPTISPASLDDDTEYQLHIPMDLYIKLGRRQKNLRNPIAGPTFTTEEVAPLIFDQKLEE